MKLPIKLSSSTTLRFICYLCLAILPFCVSAQEERVGNWLMYFGQNQIGNNLSIHSEVQYRNHTTITSDIEQLLLRTGLNYHLNSEAFFTAGYARIFSYNYNSEQRQAETAEHRIWQQLITTQVLGRVKFEHRYRVEQRWVNASYSTRLRYRLMLFVPLNNTKIKEGTIFLAVYDEIFVNTEKVFFDRNRFYGAVGYQLNQKVGIQLGSLHQQVDDFGKWYLQFALVFNPVFRKSGNDKS